MHSSAPSKPVEAIVLAAGRSLRMGRPKLTLPWGKTTVLGAVIQALADGGATLGLQGILVVTGGHHWLVEELLRQLPCPIPIRWTYNPNYEGEMLLSLQEGLRHTLSTTQAALVTLGDQPQILSSTVQAILQCYQEEGHWLIAPSYQMRRGHPWLVARPLWKDLLALSTSHTLRDFFRIHAGKVYHLMVETPTVLKDLDTPEDYARERPQEE
ncbi:MAG: nucleotidyltransferase family protein [Anaerolineales bacterium]|nr:nucleotidyltransferase family protein [Anaerolineales bacterium]MDW8161547.1 nucleotidyltransferase family protein [Anaerolineales bacterium]